jgi:ABC-2 type transport system ATP-binding protein
MGGNSDETQMSAMDHAWVREARDGKPMNHLVSNNRVAVQFQHVSKTFGGKSARARLMLWRDDQPAAKVVRALDDVSIDVRKNEIYGILGANGSGKSTLVRLISTLLIADKGAITVFGLDVRDDESKVKRLINRVSVEASFFKKLSPMENLLYSSRLYGRGGAELRRDIKRILIDLGIPEARIGAPLETMSRGMQQKVAIARAFLTSPVLLLLDEPTTGLDPRSKKDVQRFVLDLRDAHDATVLICTHDMDEAELLCDRIAIMDGGRIVAVGTVTELKAKVAAMSGAFNPSLEDVYMALTGHELSQEQEMPVASVA